MSVGENGVADQHTNVKGARICNGFASEEHRLTSNRTVRRPPLFERGSAGIFDYLG